MQKILPKSSRSHVHFAPGAGMCKGRSRPRRPGDPARRTIMAFVVTEPCVGCKYTDCVTVCPCDCFREGEAMLFIDPEHCIDCEACVPECPADAIYHESSVPPQWRHYVALNAEGARRHPPITEKRG